MGWAAAARNDEAAATFGGSIGNAFRVASRVRSAYTALRYVANIGYGGARARIPP